MTLPNIYCAFLFLWVVSTFFLGGVAPAYERVHPVLCAILALSIFVREKKNRSDTESPPFPMSSLALGLFFAITCLVVLQMLPFPRSILRFLAPLSNELKYKALSEMGIPPNSYGYPVTLDPSATYLAFQEWISFGLLVAIVIYLLREPQRREWLARFICGFAAFISFFGLIHRFSKSTKMFWFLERGWTFFGPYVNVNHAGALFAVAGAMILVKLSHLRSKTDRAAWSLAMGLISLGLFFTGSRAALLSFSVASFIYFFLRPHRKRDTKIFVLFSILGAFLLAILWRASLFVRLISTPSSLTEGRELRTQFWTYAIHILKESPWLGIGLGSFTRVSPMFVGDALWIHPEHVENDYLEALVALGAVGGLCALYLYGLSFYWAVKILKSAESHSANRAFAAGWLALSINLIFVFHSPLPSHQILIAMLLGGILSTRRFFIFASRKVWIAFASLSVFGLLLGIKQMFKMPVPEAQSAQAHLQKDPLYPPAYYALAVDAVRMGNFSSALQAYRMATRLDPFDLARRIEVARGFEESFEFLGALEIYDSILNGPANLSANQKYDLEFRSTLMAIKLSRTEDVSSRLSRLRSLDPGDWRVELLGGEIVRSWQLFMKQHVPARNWDDLFFQLAVDQAEKFDLKLAGQSLAPFRNDIGVFLARMSPLLDEPLYLSIDQGKPSPRLKTNSATTEANTLRDVPMDPLQIPEEFTVRVSHVQAELDTYLLPVNLDVNPPELSVRVVVSSLRPLGQQLVVQAEGSLFLSKEEPEKRADGKWNLYFRRVGETALVSGKPVRHITGVGFTPLERDGTYSVGPIEVFVDSSR